MGIGFRGKTENQCEKVENNVPELPSFLCKHKNYYAFFDFLPPILPFYAIFLDLHAI